MKSLRKALIFPFVHSFYIVQSLLIITAFMGSCMVTYYGFLVSLATLGARRSFTAQPDLSSTLP